MFSFFNSQNFYPCLALLLKTCGVNVDPEDITPSFTKFSLIYCGIIVCVLAFPLLIMKDMRIVVKINSFGIYFVSILLLFVIYNGISSLFNTNFDFGYFKNAVREPRYLYLFGPDLSFLMGTLSLGYFSHSFVLPLMRNNENQQNNTRDLLFGYLCVMATYVVVGSLGYIGFSGINYKNQFQDNWFRFFPADNICIIILRLISVIQLLSILPILFSIVRTQFFDTFLSTGQKTKDKQLIPYDPTSKEIIIFSFILSLFCLIILYFFYNRLGKMLGIIGATTGLFLIYIIPLIMNFIYYYRKHLTEDKFNDIFIKNEDDPIKMKEGIEVHIDNYGLSTKPKNQMIMNLFYVLNCLLVLFGFFTFIIQFIPINFFGIILKEYPNQFKEVI